MIASEGKLYGIDSTIDVILECNSEWKQLWEENSKDERIKGKSKEFHFLKRNSE